MGPALLIVEDDPIFSRLLKLIFKDITHNVLTAANGIEALRILAENKVSCIVSDIKMPKMGGIEFVEKVRAEYHEIPIIVFSGHLDFQMQPEILRHNVQGIFHKPDLDELEEAVRKVILSITEVSMKNDSSENIVLRQIIDNIPYFVFWKDRNSTYLGCNSIFAQSAGFKTADEMVGKTDYDACWTKEESDSFRAMDKEVMVANKPLLSIEEPQMQLDGSTKTVLTSKVPLHNIDGEVVGILGIYADITARKDLEKEKDAAIRDLKLLQEQLIHTEKMRSLGEMAGGIAHEINNPLAIINGNMKLLRRTLSSTNFSKEEIFESLTDIEVTVSRISNIVKSLRAISREESQDEIPMKFENLSEIIRECVILCEQKFKDLDIELNVSLGKENCFVKCNRVSLSQSILNLLNNARDAVDGQVKHSRKVAIEVSYGKTCKISVIDSGAGISLENRQKIFQPFFTTKEVGKGTGIGLSISKALLEKQGARLDLGDDAQTCFMIQFPGSAFKF